MFQCIVEILSTYFFQNFLAEVDFLQLNYFRKCFPFLATFTFFWHLPLHTEEISQVFIYSI